MPYNSNTTRTDIAPLIPEDVATEILDAAEEQSVVLQLARRLQDMPSQVRRMPVLDTLPVAYFVGNKGDGDVSAAGLKQTTEMAWANKYIYAEELAVIVPIAENVLDDAGYDLWAQIMPHLTAAFGRAIDAAVLFGTNKPTDWPAAILAGATSAGQTVDLSNSVAAGSDLYDTLLGEGGVWSLVEEDGYDVTGAVGALSMRAKLRGARNTDGNPIFRSVGTEGRQMYEVEGVPFMFPKNGAFDASQALLFAGDWSQLLYAFRKDLTFKVLDQGVITDASNNIIYNLPQQDMVALRAVMRIGFALPNPLNIVNQNNSTRYPFAVLVP